MGGPSSRRAADGGLEYGQGEAGRRAARIAVRVGQVAPERERVAGLERDLLLVHLDDDDPLQHVQQLSGTGSVGVAGVAVTGPSVQSHSSTTSGGVVLATRTARPPPAPDHSTGPVPLRVTVNAVGPGESTSADSPTPSASLNFSRMPMLGFATPCSILINMRRLTPDTSTSWSSVHCRA